MLAQFIPAKPQVKVLSLLGLTLYFLSRHCVYTLVRFQHKNHLVRVRNHHGLDSNTSSGRHKNRQEMSQ